jgi:murein tripeptide amidase MpaA
MKNLFTPLVICVFIPIYSLTLIAQSSEVMEKYSKVRITVQNRADLKELQQAGLSLEGMKLEVQSVEVILSESEIIKLNSLGFSYQILIDDMTKYYQERSRRTETEMKNLKREMKQKYTSGGFGFGSMGGYYTYDEVVAELDTMRTLYPNLITEKYSIGTTLEGRTIWAVKISDNPGINENEPELFYNALVHGREPAGMMALIYFMYNLLENYGSDPEITYLVDNREFYIVPVINPDGYVYNQQTNPNGGGMWRKNRRDVGGTVYGVDLCRNYDYRWGYNNIGSSPNPSDEDYRGTAPFSEPETQAVRDFCLSHNFIICNNFHSYGDVVYAPWGYNLTQTPDSTIFNNTIGLATQLNNYVNWINYLGIYERNGDHLDWQYGEQTTKPKIFAYLLETGNNDDGFWPVQGRIFPIAEENVYLNKVLAWGPGVIYNPPHIVESSVYPSYCIPSEDSITITATESNPDNFNSIVTAYLYDSEDNLSEEFEMSEINTNTYLTSRLSPQEENFYHLLLKDSGVQIPSNFYYQNDFKFTTAGPLRLDNLAYVKGITNYYNIRPFVRNDGNSLTITNAKLRLYCDDPWVTTVSATTVSFSPIAPSATVGGNTWIAVNYDPATFPGYFNLKVEISKDGYVYWTDSMRVETTFQLAVSIANGWNIVSIPGLHPVDQNVLTWWPGKDPLAEVFKYGGVGYNVVNTATPGEGYWMKHLGANVYNTGEEWPASGIQKVLHNSITAFPGWNLIGGYELSVGTAGITTNPPGLQSGPIYKYSGGYQIATTLEPGHGYWIKLNAAGQIIIPETLAKGTEPVEYFPKDWGRIILTDATGVNYTVYAVNGNVDLSQYELPPASPEEMFDIRFSSGRIAENLCNTQSIYMKGVVYPLTMRVENMNIRIQDGTGKMLNVNLKDGEDIVIDNSTITKLMVSGELIPLVYSLSQNYPNPFNPSTKIQYSIREKQFVTLIIYNILGSEVTTLVNEEKTAGKYEIEFSAKGGTTSGGNAYKLPSGVYFYQLRAGSFVETKKMILIK